VKLLLNLRFRFDFVNKNTPPSPCEKKNIAKYEKNSPKSCDVIL